MLHVRICSIRSRIAILRSWWFCLLSMSGAWEPLRLASPGSDADSSARQLGGGDAALGCICCQVSWDSSIKEQLSAWEQVRSLKLRDACCRTPLALSLHFPSFSPWFHSPLRLRLKRVVRRTTSTRVRGNPCGSILRPCTCPFSSCAWESP